MADKELSYGSGRLALLGVLASALIALVAFTHPGGPFGPGAAHADETFNVNTFADPPNFAPFACAQPPGECSLRRAVQEANNAGPGTHTINLPAGTYALSAGSGGELGTAFMSGSKIVIVGATGNPADTIITAAGQGTRVFQAFGFSGLELVNLTITGGSSTNGGAIFTEADAVTTLRNSVVTGNKANSNFGGGIYSRGHLTLIDSTISANEAPNGGGIYAEGNTGTASLTITRSTITGNKADMDGAGLYNTGPEVKITASTISDNQGGAAGGGIYHIGVKVEVISSTISNNSVGTDTDTSPLTFGGGIYSAGDLIVTNSTIIGNFAKDVGGGVLTEFEPASTTMVNSTITGNHGIGAVSSRFGGIVTLYNSVIVDQRDDDNADCGPEAIVAGADNLDSDGTCGESATQADAGDFMAPLGGTFGPTLTHALLPGSLAIDTGSNATCSAAVGSPTFGAGGFDQRGIPRPQPVGGICDKGAYEVAPDSDGEGIPDVFDNCPLVPNPSQANFDGDALGDACDPDDDNDNVADGPDTCENTPAAQRPVTTNGCSEGQLGLVRPAACIQGPLAYNRLIVGTAAANNLTAVSGTNSIIYGLGGNDNITNASGLSCLIGGDGNDNLKGGSGSDVLVGGAGTDKGVGGAGFDRCGLDVEVRTECESTF